MGLRVRLKGLWLSRGANEDVARGGGVEQVGEEWSRKEIGRHAAIDGERLRDEPIA